MFSLSPRLMLLVIALFLLKTGMAQRTLVHAHNDYQKEAPLTFAISQKADIIEADVYPVNGILYVAHDKEEITGSRTLDSLYLQPIIQRFLNNGGNVSKDTSYTFALCIDIKENPAETIRLLTQLLQSHLNYFDRSLNKKAVQVIISGDRGEIGNWKQYPPYIYMDGRPYEQYDDQTNERIAMISDSYKQYTTEAELRKMIIQAHTLKKPVRVWAAPDNENGWKNLIKLGVGVINTDYPEQARAFLDKKYKALLSK